MSNDLILELKTMQRELAKNAFFFKCCIYISEQYSYCTRNTQNLVKRYGLGIHSFAQNCSLLRAVSDSLTSLFTKERSRAIQLNLTQKRAIPSKKFVFFVCFWNIFLCFMPKSKSLFSLFAHVFFIKSELSDASHDIVPLTQPALK